METVRSPMSRTLTVPEPLLATYACSPRGPIATPSGLVPTGIVNTARAVAEVGDTAVRLGRSTAGVAELLIMHLLSVGRRRRRVIHTKDRTRGMAP
ncbi:hypothetical protein GCM10015535_66680 [Streptomyces gelaticus]|uniref:Uncharacterized protein n=1 Tax=Streptomyces gelaticus TaxID=285446 RepID=A0ABQ2WBA5_9ACTN|nr:hypothetical protein GCM10015535_66680 [Streptomyces gelaticus]